jgi:uncharacterized protein (TIGR02118 family)
MPAKIVVLYPKPAEPDAFERAYHGEHMPMMRRIVVPAARVPTYAVRGPAGAPFYRMAEIHFADSEQLGEFARSEQAQIARLSAARLSTGGKPLVLVCEADER